MNDLRIFTRHPTKANMPLLRYLPFIHSVVMWEFNSVEKQIRKETLGICEWLYVRAHTCYAFLKVHDAPQWENFGTESGLSDDWVKVCGS